MSAKGSGLPGHADHVVMVAHSSVKEKGVL
jgi:hypothetical protein